MLAFLPFKRISSNWLLLALSVAVLGLTVSSAWAGNMLCGATLSPCASEGIQSKTPQNSQTTGAAATAVTVTLAASAGTRHYLHTVEARCNTAAATSALTITDAGTTIFSSQAALVTTTANYVKAWAPALSSAALNTAMVITWAACSAGTGTLIVQADTW